jgi:hypothetical protein
MHAAGLRPPVDCDTLDNIAAYGQCFALDTGRGACAFVLRKKGDVLWIDAAAATRPGAGVTEDGMQLAEAIARQTGCTQIAMETNRRGLLRKTQKNGYVVAGYILKKALK